MNNKKLLLSAINSVIGIMRQKILNKDKMVKKIKKRVTEKVFDPSKYRGIYKNLKVSLDDEIIELRKEWTRD